MKKLFYISLLFVLFSLSVHAERSALFIGNSFSASNNMPYMLGRLAAAAGDSVYTQLAWNGQTLSEQQQNPDTRTAIESREWDYVVLQQQSQISGFAPGWDVGEFEYYSHAPSDTLNMYIKSNSECTQTVFFMTWGYLNGDTQNFPGDDYFAQQQRIRRNYLYLSETFDGICSPVGLAWQHVRTYRPWIDLYDADNYHPNINGSYLAACVFYAAIYEKSPYGLDFYADIPDTVAQYLQEVAGTIVLDSLSVWNIGQSIPNIGPRLINPSADEKEISLDADFSWEATPNTDYYHFQLSQNANFSPILIDSTDIITTNVSFNLPNFGKDYYWRVTSVYRPSEFECETYFHEKRKFTTEYEGPELVSPADDDSCVNLDIACTWKPLGSGEQYRFQLSKSKTFNTLIHDERPIAVTFFQITGLEPATTYYWRVQEHEGTVTDKWSETRSFTTRILPPMQETPADQSIGIYPQNVDFIWTGAGNGAKYEFQLSLDSQFGSMLEDLIDFTDTTVTVDLNIYDTTFFWRVKALWETCSTSWSETYSLSTAKAPPVLVFPDSSTSDNTLDIVFRWNTVEDALYYEFALYDTSIIIDDNLLYGKSSLPSASIIVRDLQPYKMYWWRVKAYLDGYETEWSDVWDFETGIGDITPPDLIAPKNKSESQPLELPFEWTEEENAESYNFQLAYDDDFTQPVYDETGFAATSLTYTELVNGTNYFWRVSTNGGGKQSGWSEIWSFTTVFPTLEDSVTLIAPPNDTTDMPLNVLLQWEALDGAQYYHLNVAVSPNFEEDSLITDESEISTTEKTVMNLQYGTEYFWRIAAYNDAGQAPWSEVRSFTTKDEVSVNEHLKNSGILLVPNPTEGNMKIISELEIQKVTVTDIHGNTLSLKIRHNDSNSEIDLSEYPAGVYILNIHTQKGIVVEKIIKK